MEYEKKQKIKFIAFVIFVYIFCAFLMTLGLVDYFDDKGKADAIKSGVVVQAEWVGIIPNMHKGGTSTTYNLGYEYIDGNGVRYREECSFRLNSLEEAKSYMGKKIDIYIDGKGHSITVEQAKDFNQNFAWWLMGIGIGLAVSYTVGLMIWRVIKYRRNNDDTGENTPSENV